VTQRVGAAVLLAVILCGRQLDPRLGLLDADPAHRLIRLRAAGVSRQPSLRGVCRRAAGPEVTVKTPGSVNSRCRHVATTALPTAAASVDRMSATAEPPKPPPTIRAPDRTGLPSGLDDYVKLD
jgi:hypothetical protein